ncbi:MAG: cytochrome c family protein [Pseudomonadota bacterium]
MSSIELNKIFAAVLVAGILAMLSGFVGRLLVPEAHYDENAYKIEVLDDGGADVAAVEEEALPEVGPLLASADPAAGESGSRACAACHSFDNGGANKVGPNLWDIVNKPIGGVDGFGYSDVLAGKGADGAVWDYESLNAFLAAPRDWAPGTAMSYAGMRNEDDRANIIAWMRTLSDSPAALPE